MALTAGQVQDLARLVAGELLSDPETMTIIEMADDNGYPELTRDDIIAVARKIDGAEVRIR